MILVDTGPFVALFDPKDPEHERCKQILHKIKEELFTTIAVLTEAFHMLPPGSRGADNLRAFVLRGGVSIWFMDDAAVARAFELMEKYADLPMDLADASLITAAETLDTRKVFTVDHRDYSVFRIRRGHRHMTVEVVK